ncbi:MAG: hypothetical protein K9G57_09090 [Ignavibacteriales bacterium]|nr:hypothetical protein [Ignavibacteriales bacterium]
MNDELIKFRHLLHQCPKLVNDEIETSKRISNFMDNYKPDKVIYISKTGKLFVFDSKEVVSTTVFRADNSGDYEAGKIGN